MSDLVELIKTSDLVPSDKDRARLIKAFQERSVSPLSPEREMGPFLLYSVGDSIESVAHKTTLPKDIILCTAIYYNWPEKAKALKRESINPLEIQKDLANTLLIATYKSLLIDLGDVIAGRKVAKDVSLIPKNINSLAQLMNMVKDLNTVVESLPQAPTTPTNIIHAQNVQVNNQLSEKEKPAEPEDPSRAVMLKALEEL